MNQDKADNAKNRRLYAGLAIASIIIGVLMLIFTIFCFIMAWILAWTMTGVERSIMNGLSNIGIVANTIGTIFGVYGLYSRKRGMAVAGIVLCLLLFIPVVLIKLGYLWFYVFNIFLSN